MTDELKGSEKLKAFFESRKRVESMVLESDHFPSKSSTESKHFLRPFQNRMSNCGIDSTVTVTACKFNLSLCGGGGGCLEIFVPKNVPTVLNAFNRISVNASDT
jgi:hypothetical protein